MNIESIGMIVLRSKCEEKLHDFTTKQVPSRELVW
jgi:hypothetical protein